MRELLFAYIITISAFVVVCITGFILHRQMVMELEARVQYFQGLADANQDNFYRCDKQLYELGVMSSK